MNGILIVNKPKGLTSRDVVNQVSKLLGIKKMGHTGTLDPIATGVLVVTVGKGTKLTNQLQSATKEYIATALFGIETDTLDTEGTILKQDNHIPSEFDARKVLLEMQGEYEQEVPMYSAIKVKGKKLYELARKGEKIELPKRNVTIYETEFLSFQNRKITFRIVVSKGTYIRSFIRDFAHKLNTVAVMSDLCRTKQGNFTISEAVALDKITPKTKLISIQDALSIPKKEVPNEWLKKVKNGANITLSNPFPFREVLWTHQNKALAIYICEGLILKPKIMLLEEKNQ